MKTISLISLILSTLLCAQGSINTPVVVPNTGNVTLLQSQSDKELQWVDEQINAIVPSRIGVADGFINSLIDPIKYIGKVNALGKVNASGLLPPPKLGMPMIPKVIEEPLRLQALMNKSALINGKWYKVNDSVRAYSLTEIKASSVLLNRKKGQPLILFLNKTNSKITINTK